MNETILQYLETLPKSNQLVTFADNRGRLGTLVVPKEFDIDDIQTNRDKAIYNIFSKVQIQRIDDDDKENIKLLCNFFDVFEKYNDKIRDLFVSKHINGKYDKDIQSYDKKNEYYILFASEFTYLLQDNDYFDMADLLRIITIFK